MDGEQRKALKRWKGEERAAARARFPLSDEMLEAFFAHVEERKRERGCDHTRRFATEWLAARGLRTLAVIEWLDEHGGFCDCEVANVKSHWLDNRLEAHMGDDPGSDGDQN
jgi:uncharacterized protein DUF2695